MLHLWSLGVEEQFYILFPLILALLARWWRQGALAVVIAMTLGSLALNSAALAIGGASPAFFLLPTRAWELGAGAILALLPATLDLRPRLANAASLAGAFLMLASLMFPIEKTPLFPVALPAVAGACLLIFSGNASRPWVNRALELRPVVFVGLISYSLYLWHWPIIVLAQYYFVRNMTLVEAAAAVALMAFCASLSWRFVERPFRSRNMGIWMARAWAAGGVAMLAGAATALILAHGLPGRLSAQAARINEAVGAHYRCPVSDYVNVGAARGCLLNQPSRNPADADVVLLGNSHVQMYAPAWSTLLARHGQTGVMIPVNSCLPTVTANISPECSQTSERNLAELAKLTRARNVIIGINWWHETDLVDQAGKPLNNVDNMVLGLALEDLAARIRAQGKHVILIGPIAEPRWDVASVMSRQLAFGWPVDHPTSMAAAAFDGQFGTVIRHFENRPDITLVRPDQVQCNTKRCEFLLDGRSLFADDNHIAASELPRFYPVFEAAVSP